ncbi:MAG TPA: hypothetical protein VFI10_04280 [Gaiellaceae bacterium]|jgi:hypothetical protein|nr:hypothetical protein [Gaiellaceae bacterium]
MTTSRTRPWLDAGADVTIRRADAGDDAALRRLAALAEAAPLRGDVLVAEVDDEPWAALALEDGRTISDPFRPTLALRELLELRRRNLLAAARPPRRFDLLRHRFA